MIRDKLRREQAVYELLDHLGMYWERWEHEPATTIRDCEEVGQKMGVSMCKNLFLCNRQHTEFYLLMLPGEKPFRTREISAQIPSSRLSFAEPDYLLRFLNLEPGAVSVMGLMNDRENRVKLLIDRQILEEPYLGCHPCVNTSSIKLKMQEVLDIFLPSVRHSYQAVEILPEFREKT